MMKDKSRISCSRDVLHQGSISGKVNGVVPLNLTPGNGHQTWSASAIFSATVKRVILFLICLLAIPSASLAQRDQSSWANLSSLQTGQKIEVLDMASKKHRGTFVSVSGTAITYRDSAGEQSIPKQNIRGVQLTANKRRLRNTLIGAGIGAGAGAGITAAAWESNGFLGNKGVGAAVGAVLGGFGGAVVGALLPSHHWVYRVGP